MASLNRLQAPQIENFHEAEINTIILEPRASLQTLDMNREFLKAHQKESKNRIEELSSDLKKSTGSHAELDSVRARTKQENDQLKTNLDKEQFDETTFNLLGNFKKENLSNSMEVTGMTICHTFRNVTKHITSGMLSDPQHMHGLLWHIQLRPEPLGWSSTVQSGMFLGIFLYCSSRSPSGGWSCRAKHTTTLYANNTTGDALCRKGVYNTYSSETPNWGRIHFVNWTDLFTKYVKHDSIKVKMEIWTDQPQGISISTALCGTAPAAAGCPVPHRPHAEALHLRDQFFKR